MMALPRLQAVRKQLDSGLSALRFKSYVLLTTRQIKKSKTNYCLGFFSCWIVVLLVALLDTGLQRAPVAFLKLAELQSGEQDVVLTPAGGLLNYTVISSRLTDPRYSYHSPRYATSDAFVYSQRTCDMTGADPSSGAWIYGSPVDICSRGLFTYDACCLCLRCPEKQKVNLYIIDFEQERRIGVGRGWGTRKPDRGSVYIDQNTARILGAGAGSRIYLKFRFEGPVRGAMRRLNFTYAASYGAVHLNVRVQGTVSSTLGKTPEDVTNAVFMDYRDVGPLLTDPGTARPSYASQVTIQLPDRLDVYVDPSYDVILQRVVDFSSAVLFSVGFDQVSSKMPVAEQLGESKTFSLYLSLLLAVIFALLIVLALILIYSLLIISVQTRTFELGLLRMVGVTRRGVLELLLVHALAFAVPAWVLGLLLAQIAAVPAMRYVSRLVEAEVSPLLFPRSVGAATAVAFAVPLAAAVLPIRAALRSNLHDSLDTRHSKTKAVVYTIERAEKGDVPWGALLIGFMLAVFGFLIYYVVPLALLSFDLLLLLGIFFALLMGMIAGCVILLMNIEHFVQRGVVQLFFFWEGPSVRGLVVKNMVAHRPRNRKTTVMYALALGFIIFVSVAANLQIETFRYQTLQRSGTYLRVWAPSWSSLNDVLPELEAALRASPLVEAHAYVRQPAPPRPARPRAEITKSRELNPRLDFAPPSGPALLPLRMRKLDLKLPAPLHTETKRNPGGLAFEILALAPALLPTRMRAPSQRLASLGPGQVTKDLKRVWGDTDVKPTRVSNLGRAFSDGAQVYGVSPGFHDAAEGAFLIVPDQRSNIERADLAGRSRARRAASQVLNGALPPAAALHTLEGSQAAVLGSTLRSSLGLSLDDSFLFSNARFPDDRFRRLRPWAFADQVPPPPPPPPPPNAPAPAPPPPPQRPPPRPAPPPLPPPPPPRPAPAPFPGFKFSKFPTVTNQDVLVSLPSFLRFCRGAFRSVEDIPYGRLFIKLKPRVTSAQRSDFVAALARATRANSAVEVWNFYDRTSAINAASRILDAFFVGATIIAMFLCLFSLTASMYSNIHEQAKEIGVLRAMGATRSMVVRLYCYEAFSLVISASLLALLIGLGIGYTMTLQRFLFTQLPVPFYFPYVLVAVIFAMAVACALASSAWPAWGVVRTSVVDVMRRLE
eukprot:tig00000317_g24027.t1